jgi:hypothetical protein
MSVQTASPCKEFRGSISLIFIRGREKLAEQGRRVRIGPVRRRLVSEGYYRAKGVHSQKTTQRGSQQVSRLKLNARKNSRILSKCCALIETVVSKLHHFVVSSCRQVQCHSYPVDLGDSGADLANLYVDTAPSRTSILSVRSIGRYRSAHLVTVVLPASEGVSGRLGRTHMGVLASAMRAGVVGILFNVRLRSLTDRGPL